MKHNARQDRWDKCSSSTLRKTVLLSTVVIFAVILTGCGKKTESPTSNLGNPPSETVNSAPSPEPAIKQPTVAGGTSETPMDLSALTRAARKFSADNRRLPTSFDELITSGYIRKDNLPAIPAGKKLGINPKRVEVIIVNQ